MTEPVARPNNCKCSCHDGVKIFCSCWMPCCPEPYAARAELKPLPPPREVKIGSFNKFVFPLVRQPRSEPPPEHYKAKRERRRKKKGR